MTHSAYSLVSSLLFNFRSPKSTIISLLLCLTIAAGLYASVNIVLLFLGVEDPDSLHSLMLWQGVSEHGLSWLADWRYTQDNWLLSLVPLHFLGFLIFGSSHALIVVSGWLIFIGSACSSAAIAWSIGARRAAVFILLLLLNFGMYAHVYGFVAYSTSHNITNLYGLLSVLVMVRWYIKPRSYLLCLLFFVLVCGAISDPWMLPAFNLPILLLGLISLGMPGIGIDKSHSLKLILASGLSILAVETKLLGFLHFLPDVEFALADWPTIMLNFGFVFRSLGGLLNLVPFSAMNDFLPGLISIVILLVLLVSSLIAYLHSAARITSNPVLLAFLVVVFFSIGGTALAAIVSSVEGTDNTARFLINIAYLFIVTVAILIELNWDRSSQFRRSSAGAIFGLFVVSSFISASTLMADYEGVVTLQVEPIVSELRANQLEYGYGSYWDPAPANAITAASNFEILVRPVTFNSASCEVEFRRAESSRRWYLDGDIPEGTRELFIMLDFNQQPCANGSDFEVGLLAQFGEAIRSFEFGGVKVLVWDHKLIGFVQPLNITPGQTIDFSNSGLHPNGAGWSVGEAWGTWSIEDMAALHFELANFDSDYLEMTVNARAFFVNESEPSIIQVTANQLAIGELRYDPQSRTASQTLQIPASLIRDAQDNLVIKFLFSDLRSPAELGTSTDTRRLGIGLESISFR